MTHEYDFIEQLRASLYPRLHPVLRRFGGYAVGTVGRDQYVTTLDASEDAVEKYLIHTHGFERNALAAYKTAHDGRDSTLSLRLTHAAAPDYVEPAMQLHWTFFDAADGMLDVYAHYEDDWAVNPLAHLREENFSAAEGVRRSRNFLDNETKYPPAGGTP